MEKRASERNLTKMCKTRSQLFLNLFFLLLIIRIYNKC